MKEQINVLSLFDGLSCGQATLKEMGINVGNYFASEIDKQVIKIAMANFPNTVQLGDVKAISVANTGIFVNGFRASFEIPDLIIGGSPCQDLSSLKNGEGLEGEKSKLFFEYIRILNEIRKVNPNVKFLLENVVPRKKEWKQEIDKIMSVEGILINSDLFLPHNRPRIYWTNIEISPLPQRPNWNKAYYQYRLTYFRKNKSGVCPCLTANMGTGGHNVPLKSENLKDKLTPEECEALQGLPQGYTKGVANSHRYKAIGNGWTIPVIKHIFKSL